MQAKETKNIENKKITSPLKAGIMGVAATGITMAAAVMLSDKKRRKKVGKTLSQLGEKGREWIGKAQMTLNKMEKKFDKMNERVPSKKTRLALRS